MRVKCVLLVLTFKLREFIGNGTAKIYSFTIYLQNKQNTTIKIR